jgi:chemotaxis protein methyltransferase CheR
MKAAEFLFLADLLRRRSGLVLTPDKAYLVESRLGPVALREGCATISDLIGRVRAGGCEALTETLVDAMTTNETLWFRDRVPFDLFREEMLPGLAAARPDGAVKVWCAAASTGQEPWSLAMIAKDAPSARVDILGTDISERCLIKARTGIYSAFEVQRGLPIQLMLRWFDKMDDVWRIRSELRRAVRWDRVNLVEDFSRLGRFDVVFCRNVLIYFDEATRADVLERIARQLADDGFLVLGAAETVLGLTEALRPAPGRRGVYVKTPGYRRAAA